MAAKPSLESPPSNVPSLVPLGSYAGNPPLRLKKTALVIGAAESCRLRLISSTISKQHALIVTAEDGVYIRDLASRTKVLVNNIEQHETELSDGDEIRVGRFSFKFAATAPSLGLAIHAPPAAIAVDGNSVPSPIQGRVLLIGRMTGCDLRLTGESVSTRHAVIFQAGGIRYVRDLNSRTGTFLNGARIHQQEIKFGDQLRVGDITISLLPDEAASPTADSHVSIETGSAPLPAAPIESVRKSDKPIRSPSPISSPASLEPAPAPVAESTTDLVDFDADMHGDDLSGDTRIDEVAPQAAASSALPPVEPALPLAENPALPQEDPINFEFVAPGHEDQPPAEPDLADDDLAEFDRPRRGWRGDSWREEPVADSDAASDPPSSVIPLEPIVDLVPPEPRDATVSATTNTAAVEPAPSEPTVSEIPDLPATVEPATPAPEPAAPEPIPAEIPHLSPTIELAAELAAPIAAPGDAEPILASPASEISALPVSIEPQTPSESAAPAPTTREPISAEIPDFSPTTDLATPVAAPGEAEPILASAASEISALPAPVEPQTPSEPAVPAVNDVAELPAPIPAPPRRGRPPKASSTSDSPKIARTRTKRIPPSKATEEPQPLPSQTQAVELQDDSLAPQPAAPTNAPPIPVPATEPAEIDLSNFQTDLKTPAFAPSPSPALDEEPPTHALYGQEEILPPHQEKSELFEGSVRASSPPPPESPIAGLQIHPEDFADVAPAPLARDDDALALHTPLLQSPPPSPAPPLAAPGEVLDGPEASPESTLDLDLSLPDLPDDAQSPPPPPPEPAAAEPGDTAFGAMVDSFSGESTGPLVEPELSAPDATPPDAEPHIIAGSSFSFDIESTIDHVAPPHQLFATTDSTTTEPLQPAAPLLPASPPTTPRQPAPLPPASPRLIEPPLSSFGGFGIFQGASIDMDHFLGGMPLQLQELRPPPSTFGKVAVRFDAKPAASQPQPPTAAPPTAPPPPTAKFPAPPPKLKRPAAPFATDPFAISPDDITAPDVSGAVPAFAGPGHPTAGKITTVFDGLAMPPVRETDVFSEFDAVSSNDAAFGGARLSRADDYVLPESPAAAARLAGGTEKDFAEDEFWNRTDEEEGLPPMGVPRPPAPGADENADNEQQVLPSGDFERDQSRRPPEPPAPVQHQPRKRRRLRIPFLMLIMFLILGALLAVIWLLVPVKSQVVGNVTYLNYAWTPGTRDGADFEAQQRRLLADEHTRQRALDLLNRDNPQVGAGFLEIPTLFDRAASSLSLDSSSSDDPPRTSARITYDGTNGPDDALRMGVLLQSLIAANAPLQDATIQRRGSLQNSQRAVDDAAKKLAGIQNQIAQLQLAVDQQPPADALTQLTAQKAELERARFAAEDAVDADRAELARLRQGPATQPDATDPSLRQLRRQLADLTAELTVARSDQAAGVTLARQQLEDAVKQFNDQLVSAGAVLDESSKLRQFVDSAGDSQTKAHELIDVLIIDGQDLEKELEDTRRDVEDLIQERQQERWSADVQLQQLQATLDSAQHRYNAATGQGITDPRVLDPLQKEIDGATAQVKARQAQLGVDPSEVKVEDGLDRVIQSLRRKLQNEKLQIDQVLDPLEKQLNDLNPVVAALPGAQQELARQIHQRLAALNDARRHYADAVGEGETAPSAKVTGVQQQIDALKARMTHSLDADRFRDLAATQVTLDADEKNLDVAKNAYDDIRISYDDATARHDAANAAQLKLIRLLDDKNSAASELESAQRDRDGKTTAAGDSYELKPFDQAKDVRVIPNAVDPRWNDSLYAGIAVVLVFAGLVGTSRMSAGRTPLRASSARPGPAARRPVHGDDRLPDDEEEPLIA